MAAFCTCCGAAITLKSVACPVCGSPSHGMKARVAVELAEERAERPAVGEPAYGDRSSQRRNCVGCFAA
jgi:uncharacterized membrane protein YvbJ